MDKLLFFLGDVDNLGALLAVVLGAAVGEGEVGVALAGGDQDTAGGLVGVDQGAAIFNGLDQEALLVLCKSQKLNFVKSLKFFFFAYCSRRACRWTGRRREPGTSPRWA